MTQNKKLPLTVKKDIQKNAALSVIASLLLLGTLGYILMCAYSAAMTGLWAAAAAYSVLSIGLLWTFLPYVAFNCIEVYVNATRQQQNYAKVDAIVSTTLSLFRLLRMQKSLAVASLLTRLGQTRILQGNFESAENLFKEAITCTAAIPGGQKSANMAMYTLNLASAYAWQGKFVESEIEAEKSLEILQKSNSPSAKIFEPHCLLLMGINRFRLNELAGAEELLQSALDSLEKMTPSPEMPLLSIQTAKISCYLYLSLLKIKQDTIPDSYVYYNKFFELLQGSIAVAAITHIRAINYLAQELLKIGDYKHAEDLINIAYELSASAPFHPDSRETLAAYEKLLVATNRQSEIADMRSLLLPIPQIATMQKND